MWTQPLIQGEPGPCGCGCALSSETSLGFAFDIFCSEIVGRPLDPWQRWLGIHGLELLPDKRPRFRQILVLVARQNGKTEMLCLLSLFWLYILQVGLILGTSTKLDYARESWLKLVKLARSVQELNEEIAQVRNANGEQEISTLAGSRYKIAASNEEGGRSLTVARLVEDELRQHRDWSAHDAAENAMNAEPGAQAWAISNAGDDRSVVLNALQEQAVTFIETGQGDYRLGYFGWTAPDGCDVTDLKALAQANPNLGRRVDAESLVGRAQRAMVAGGEQEIGFRTEVLCQHVPSLEPQPIDVADWDTLRTDAVPTGVPAFFIDCSPDLRSASIAGAVMLNGQPHVSLADHRPGTEWLVGRVAELKKFYPAARWQFESTAPTSALAEQLQVAVDKPYTVTDMARACAHLQKMVADRAMSHSGDTVLSSALRNAIRRDIGDPGLWAWGRKKSSGDISPLVAATGALWLLHTGRRPQPAIY